MANEYLDDHEQSEAVKRWIRDNGGAIVLGVALGLAGLYGWQYWERYSVQQRIAAAEGYQQLAADVEAGNVPADPLQSFATAYGSEAYTAFAALTLADEAVAGGDLEQASLYLERAATVAEPEAVRHVAGLRLARLQHARGELEQALSTLDQHDDGAFAALAAEIRGDVLVEQGDIDAARQAYQFALDNLEAGGDRNLLQMKLDDVATASQGASS